ncbi:uncharacterized protein [Drosophila pseudoobscura]|uniref:Uncharacterized protein n=1 Tax=Drosophila pseudoobscura pseudoobscura TaxID=46245 RepID=A0A6I8W414_DROPS|nr:uncharacterized protein LOC117184467 [Drosophila pseudoobscura]
MGPGLGLGLGVEQEQEREQEREREPERDSIDGHNYAEIDVVNDSDFCYLTNLNNYYQEQRLNALRRGMPSLPEMKTTATSTSPWHEHEPKEDPPKSKPTPLQVLRNPKKWRVTRAVDDIVKVMIIASSEHVLDYDVLW